MNQIGKIIATIVVFLMFSLGSFATLILLIVLFSQPESIVVNMLLLATFGLLPTFSSVYILYLLYLKKSSTLLPHPRQVTNARKLTKEERLNQTFYELVKANNGLITVLPLAMEAQVSGQEAKKFLESKSKEFNNQIRLGQEGEVIYKFEYLTPNEKESEVLLIKYGK